jgi:hypothetical protein
MVKTLKHQGKYMVVIEGIKGLLAGFAEFYQPGSTKYPQLMGNSGLPHLQGFCNIAYTEFFFCCQKG